MRTGRSEELGGGGLQGRAQHPSQNDVPSSQCPGTGLGDHCSQCEAKAGPPAACWPGSPGNPARPAWEDLASTSAWNLILPPNKLLCLEDPLPLPICGVMESPAADGCSRRKPDIKNHFVIPPRSEAPSEGRVWTLCTQTTPMGPRLTKQWPPGPSCPTRHLI